MKFVQVLIRGELVYVNSDNVLFIAPGTNETDITITFVNGFQLNVPCENAEEREHYIDELTGDTLPGQ